MIESDKMLADYQSISEITGRMLQAARDGAWERLTALEVECRGIVDGLRSAPSEEPSGSSLSRRKAEILRKILADDAAIRSLTEPWLAQLTSMLDGAAASRRVRRAYDPGPRNS